MTKILLAFLLSFAFLGGCYASAPTPEPMVCLGTDLTPYDGERTFDMTVPVVRHDCASLCNFSRYFAPGCADAEEFCPWPAGSTVPEHVRNDCGELIRTATSREELEEMLATCYCNDAGES